MSESSSQPRSIFQAIQSIDYTVIFVRDMAAMRGFYEGVLGFPLLRQLSPKWIEYRIGNNTLALATPTRTAADAPTSIGSAALQLAFKVSAFEVDQWARELVRQGVRLLSLAAMKATSGRLAILNGRMPGTRNGAARQD